MRQFRDLLPATLSDTSIDLNDVETSTLLFVGGIISRMTDEAQLSYDNFDQESGICDTFDDLLISIVADKYKLEW